MGIALGKTPFVDWPFLYLIRAMADEIDGRFGLFQAVVKSRVSPKCLFSNDLGVFEAQQMVDHGMGGILACSGVR